MDDFSSTDPGVSDRPNPERLLRDRFELGDKIGTGGQGTTYRGFDHATATPVAIKELGLDVADDWKAIELFEREGRALRSLDHEAIPSYIDAFHLDDDDGTLRFFLVQEFVEGKTFKQLIADGQRISTEDAVAFIEQTLDILDYLHGINPPVIHRDIKPSNLILRPDKTIALVDFGAVQVVEPHTLTGSTIIGTTGYVAPEQLAGRTVPASDLYALGATVVHLLTHIHPADLPVRRMRLQFDDKIIEAPDPLDEFLHGVLEPVVEDRIANVAEARSVLTGASSPNLPATAPDEPPPVRQRPVGSRIEIREEGDNLTVGLPASGRYRRVYWASALVVLAGLASILPLVTTKSLPILAAAFGAFLLIGHLFITPTRLVIRPDTFSIHRHTVNGNHRGWTEDLADIEIREAGEEKFLMCIPLPAHLVMMEGVYSHHFGFGLTSTERRWVQGVVRRRLTAQ